MRDELNKLAERVEALTGPDRQVDEAIMAVLFNREQRHLGVREGWEDEEFEDCLPVKSWVWVDRNTDHWVSTHSHAFTASLDAAMSLVPEGCLFMARTLWDGDKTAGSAVVFHYAPTETQGLRYDGQSDALAATPALALTAAALRARAEVLP